MGLFDFFKEVAAAADAIDNVSDNIIEYKMDIEVMSTSESDTEIITDIIYLKRKLHAMHPYTEQEMRLIDKREEKNSKLSDKIGIAIELEKTDINTAVSIYEELVKHNYSNTSIPYQRLAIFYRKQKNYDDEIRIIKQGLLSLVGSGLDSFYFDFINRLEKAVILRAKSQK